MRLLISLFFISTVIHTVHSATCNLKYTGVNLASAEFGDGGSNHALSPNPGVAGTNYVYPEPNGHTSWFVQQGMNLFRLPFRWERLQTTLGGSLDSAELARLQAAVSAITNQGVYVLLDPHNYARYNGLVIGQSSGAVTNDHFSNFWQQLASNFKGNNLVIFGLMNEPYQIDTATWAATATSAIAGIRASGATNLITVPGNRWTGAHSWQNGNDGYGLSNAQAMVAVNDSLNNFVFEMHQYVDSDYSGTTSTCDANAATTAVSSTTTWLRQNGYKAIMGEIGAPAVTNCETSLSNLLSHMASNSDVWLGYTAWAAGPWWGSYFMSVEPVSSGSSLLGATVFNDVFANYIGTSTSIASTPSPTTSSLKTTSTPTFSPSANAPTTSTPTSSASTTCSAAYAQCGGLSWTGPTCCSSGSSCQYSNAYYSQCIPVSNSAGTVSPSTNAPATPTPTTVIPTTRTPTAPTPTTATPTTRTPTTATPTTATPTTRTPTTATPATPTPTTADPKTPTPTSSASTTCSAAYAQCGGLSWSGPTCCSSGTSCQYSSSYYSQCIPLTSSAAGTVSPSTNAPTTPCPTTPSPTSSASTNCSVAYSQCGGANWSGPTCCSSGNTCQYSNVYYSQCLPTSNSAESSSSQSASTQSATQTTGLAVGAAAGGVLLVAFGTVLFLRRRRSIAIDSTRLVETKDSSL